MPHLLLTVRGGFGSGPVFPGPVTLRAGNLGDSLTGSDFADLLFGGDGADFIHGSEGAGEIIAGGRANDRLRGAGGDDWSFPEVPAPTRSRAASGTTCSTLTTARPTSS